MQNIIDKETWRQFSGLELIASEVRSPHPTFFFSAYLWRNRGDHVHCRT